MAAKSELIERLCESDTEFANQALVEEVENAEEFWETRNNGNTQEYQDDEHGREAEPPSKVLRLHGSCRRIKIVRASKLTDYSSSIYSLAMMRCFGGN